MSKIHVIPHTHWDREWYFSVEDSNVLLAYNLDNILKVLEEKKNYYYLLDGQVSIIEDYLLIKPENKDRITALVKEGRLLIGPWYTQTDELTVGGESIIRNLLYGIEYAKEFGGHVDIGYLPDSFGQSAQMPHIFRGFGIDDVVLWRGVSDLDTNNTEFNWESLSGDKVFVLQLRFGYSVGQNLKADELDVKARLLSIINKLKGYATTEHIALPNGGDQVPIQKDLDEIIKYIEELDGENTYEISSYHKIIKDLKSEKVDFATLRGEFTKPKNMRVHKSIFSNRYDIKKINSDGENRLGNIIEPIASLGHNFGFSYEKGLIDRAWKLLLENQAHDSQCGCNTDTTNEDIMVRGKKAREISDGLLNIMLKKLARSIESNVDGSKLLIFNTLPYVKNGLVKSRITTSSKSFSIMDGEINVPYILEKVEKFSGGIYNYVSPEGEKSGKLPDYFVSDIYIKAKDIPAMGYKTLYIVEEENNVEIMGESKSNFIENNFFKISIEEDGRVKLLNKLTGEEFKDALIFEDGGNDGDEYNYSPPTKDNVFIFNVEEFERKISKGDGIEKLELNGALNIPKDLISRREGLVNEKLNVNVSISLEEDSPLVKLKVNVKNNVLNHRLRMLFKTGIKSDYSYADNQFGTVKRNIILKDQIEDHKNKAWKEVPINVEPMISWVELNNESKGYGVITNGIKEYQIIGKDNDIIAITLLSTVGVLGQDDLVLRPGRASGINNTIVYTPNAQLIGEYDFELALYIHEGDINESKIAVHAKEINTETITYQNQEINTLLYRLDRFQINDEDIKLKDEISLFTMENKEIIISAYKLSQNREGYILRVYNPKNKVVQGGNIMFSEEKKVTEVNFGEEAIGEERVGMQFDLGEFKACQAKTIFIKR